MPKVKIHYHMKSSQKPCCLNNEETESQSLGQLPEVYFSKMMEAEFKPKSWGLLILETFLDKVHHHTTQTLSHLSVSHNISELQMKPLSFSQFVHLDAIISTTSFGEAKLLLL